MYPPPAAHPASPLLLFCTVFYHVVVECLLARRAGRLSEQGGHARGGRARPAGDGGQCLR